LKANASPEAAASFLSRQFYTWMGPLIRRGFRKPLTVGDVYHLLDDDMEAPALYRLWTNEWTDRLNECSFL
jgi:hypothetical protein